MTNQPLTSRYALYNVSKNAVAICPEMLGASAPATLPRPTCVRQDLELGACGAHMESAYRRAEPSCRSWMGSLWPHPRRRAGPQ